MKRMVLYVLTLFSISLCSAQAPRTSWPMINGDPARTSYAQMDMNLPLHVADTLHVTYRRDNGMALWQNMLFIADYAADSNRLAVVDVTTGDSLWSFIVPETGGGMEFIPAVSEGVVLIGGQGGRGLYGLNAMTGDSLWFLPVRSLYTRCPVISDSMLYLCAGDSLTCANIHTGEVYWSLVGNTRQISPVVDEQNVYGCGYDFLYALNKITGDTVWVDDSIAVGSFMSLSVDSQNLYTGFEATIRALDKSSGSEQWTVELDTNQQITDFPGAFALTQDYLLVKYLEDGVTQNQYLLINKKTGQVLNDFTGVFMNYAAPTIVNNYLIDYQSGDLKVIDFLTGETAFEMTDLPVPAYSTQIVAANDRIYISGSGPNVLVLEGSPSAVRNETASEFPFSVYPNPVTDEVRCSFTLDKGSAVSLVIYSASGTLLTCDELGEYPAGTNTFSLSTKDLIPGIYFVRMETKQGYAVQQIVKAE